MTIAALYVDPRGVYAGLPDVELWDEQRDARLYAGPWRVVAHPPCSRWCQLASVNEARYGHAIGDDGGCFEAALRDVRWYGGVLEHPAYSIAWDWFGLNHPPSSGGWISAGFCGGWTCHVEQGRYGHLSRKATWLYAFGIPLPSLPSLRWGRAEGCTHMVSRLDREKYPDRLRIARKAAAATPKEFRDVLLGMVK